MDLNFIRNLPQTAKRGYRWLGLISLLARIDRVVGNRALQWIACVCIAVSASSLAAFLVVADGWRTGAEHCRNIG